MMIPFNQALVEKLRKKGVEAPDLVRPQFVHGDVSFEPPVVIQADLKLDGLLQVGAFTGVFGGRLRRTMVGRYCSIAPGLQTGWDEHPMDRITSSMVAYVPNIHRWGERFNVDMTKFKASTAPWSGIRGTTRIGNDVWIGHGVFLRSGVSIGDGAIIGAGSIVTKDVPAYAIVAGNPASVVRFRFPEDLIRELERIQWWRFNIYEFPPEILHHPWAVVEWLSRRLEEGAIEEYKAECVDYNLLRTFSDVQA